MSKEPWWLDLSFFWETGDGRRETGEESRETGEERPKIKDGR